MKFDAIVMNPPYGNIGTKILKELAENKVADEIVTIQPTNSFMGLRRKQHELELSDGTPFESIFEVIKLKSGFDIWGKSVDLTYPLGIMKLNGKILRK